MRQSPTRSIKNVSRRQRWSGLHGPNAALALSNAITKLSGPMLLLTCDAHRSEIIADELTFFLRRSVPIMSFPDWETLAYDGFSPHQGIISERLSTLANIPTLEQGIIITQLTTSMCKISPSDYLKHSAFYFAVGQTMDTGQVRQNLVDAGYRSVSQVNDHGEFAIRGSLFDIFPAGSKLPVRVDLLGDDIESLRYFDPQSQRSRDHIEQLQILPAREYPLDQKGIATFRQAFRRRFDGNPTDSVIYQHISEGIAAAGAEQYLPLFFDALTSLFDYLPSNTTLVTFDDYESQLHSAWQDLQSRYEQLRYDRSRPLLQPEEIYFSPEHWQTKIDSFNRIEIYAFKEAQNETDINAIEPGDTLEKIVFSTAKTPNLRIGANADQTSLVSHLRQYDGRTLIVAESTGRRETIKSLLTDHRFDLTVVDSWTQFYESGVRLALTIAPLQDGLYLPQDNLLVLAENQLFGHSVARANKRYRRNKDPHAIIRNLNELNIGAPVVHELHGIGRYQGLNLLEIGGEKNEFLTIEYADGDKLYVPVHALNFVTRYLGGPPETAPLHKLGSEQWDKARRKAMKQIRDVAVDLLDLYARRAARIGQSFSFNDAEYHAFASGFPFELTPDQHSAIEAVINDMTSLKSMDRLVCGDVGFGKTEVALRAAFVCANHGQQVALLVPTTLLAEQHGKNFEDRFADWPIRVAILSRFKTRKEAMQIQDDIANGQIDIVIGTHKLLQDDIKFNDLGLVIVDEEHRFGVHHKEKLKSLRAEVDLLTLTATPIPRTLNMAMGGIRELSLITTPPTDRLSIKTFVSQWNDQLIREACLREIKRGGQIYFVHNSVREIEKIAVKLAKLIPEASIRIGHGQMKERELESVMLDFYHRRFNLLLCTTIIESGIDVPTANTILINKADRFGLAQLHQMRGRVGRSSHRAYAYLITPPIRTLTPDAVKRLEAIESLEDLGAGFTLATHDLEIRGAGELLGDDQSGQIHQIGFTLYMDLLERAVTSLKQGHEPDLGDIPAHGSEIELHVPALLPHDYIPDVHMRLILYKRITSAENTDELRELKVEMIDRFGLLPDVAQQLFVIAELRQHAYSIGIEKIDCAEQGGRMRFATRTEIDPATLIEIIQNEPQVYRLTNPTTLRFSKTLDTVEDRVKFLHRLMDKMANTA